MHRSWLSAIAVAILLSLALPLVSVAQETGGGVGPAVGEAVPYIGEDGGQIGTITVNQIIDPFEEYDAFSSPQRGYHFVVVEVTVANSGNRPFEVSPGNFSLIDAEGFVSPTAYIGYPEGSGLSEFEYLDALAPGTEASGAIAFEVFNDSAVSRVTYSPSFDRLINVADLRTDPVQAGQPVPVMGPGGDQIAEITVNGVSDPYETGDANDVAPRGSRFVLVDVTVTNTGSRPISTSPSDIVLVDTEGFLAESTFVSFPPGGPVEFDYNDALAPGESQSGAIVYTVLAGTPVEQVVYGNLYDRSIVIADLTGAVPAPPAVASPVAPTPPAVPGSPVAGSAECTGLEAWALDMLDRINASAEVVQPLQDADVETLDPATIQLVADDLAALAEEQRQSNPPPAAAELNTLIAEDYLQALSEATAKLATALETGNAVTALVSQAEATAIQELFAEGGEAQQLFEAVEAACPAEVEALNAG